MEPFSVAKVSINFFYRLTLIYAVSIKKAARWLLKEMYLKGPVY
jgi:hypothetical protein